MRMVLLLLSKHFSLKNKKGQFQEWRTKCKQPQVRLKPSSSSQQSALYGGQIISDFQSSLNNRLMNKTNQIPHYLPYPHLNSPLNFNAL